MNNFRSFLIITFYNFLILTFLSCDNSPKFQVEGTISEADGKTLYLEAMTLDGIQRIDSTRLKADGTFHFSAPAPTNPEFYALCLDNQRINFSIDSTETVRFAAQLPTFSSSYTVEGSALEELAESCWHHQENLVPLQQTYFRLASGGCWHKCLYCPAHVGTQERGNHSNLRKYG